MPQEFDKPIPCPHCGRLLDVEIHKNVVLEFRKADCDNMDDPTVEGTPDLPEEDKFEDNGQGSVQAVCHYCGKEIGYYDENRGSEGLWPADSEDI